MKILVVEDNIKISEFIKKALLSENYVVDTSLNGEDALYLIQTYKYDLILLDIMIPIIDGITLCKKIRDDNINTPIIMLTAKSTTEDKVTGLNEGANDYITKPFSIDELYARIKVQLRTNKSVTNVLSLDNLSLDTNTKIVKRDNKTINLTQKEYILLEYLLLNKNKLLSEENINNALWDMDSLNTSNLLSVYIYRLRNKIDKDFKVKLLHTLRGQGFKLGLLDEF